MTIALADVRNQLNEVLIELSNTTEGASSRAVVKDFRARFPHLIKRASTALEDIALVQMASGLKKRKPPHLLDASPDLFSGLDQVVVINGFEEGKKVRKNKSPRKLTLREAEGCLANHKADRERNEKLIETLEYLIETARPYIEGGGTLEEGIAAAEEERKKRLGKK